MIDQLISELVAYGLQNGLIEDADKVYVTNGLLELFQKQDYQEPNASVEPRDLHFILEDMLAFALSEGILEDDTVTMKDLFDTKIMGILTPAPSVVRKAFEEKYQVSPKAATEFYYHFSQATNYIRTDRIIKDEKWETDTEFGKMDITINLSKPEKDPKAIENMALAQYIAGMGFSNVGLGIVHSMAHQLGAVYDTPHGIANAIILPTVMEYNAECTGEKYKEIAKAMGVEGVDDMSVEEYRKAAVDAVRKLSVDVGIPTKLEALKEEDLQFLAESAHADACAPGNPKDASVEDLKDLFRKIMA